MNEQEIIARRLALEAEIAALTNQLLNLELPEALDTDVLADLRRCFNLLTMFLDSRNLGLYGDAEFDAGFTAFRNVAGANFGIIPNFPLAGAMRALVHHPGKPNRKTTLKRQLDHFAIPIPGESADISRARDYLQVLLNY